MPIKLIHIKEGLRYFKRAVKTKSRGIKQYKGNSDEICRQIIEDCWNEEKEYFMTSSGHFKQFWMRDFGWCVDSLLKLGHQERVEKTLQYALKIFSKNGKITTAISPDGQPFDFPYPAVDSLPYLIRTLRIVDFRKELIKKYKDFLNKEIEKFFDNMIDKETKLVRKDKIFSSMKDYSKRKSSCYDNCMVAMLAKELTLLKELKNPFEGIDYPKLIKKEFWNGNYFYDDTEKTEFFSSDSNIFPFWLGIFEDEKMLKSVIKQIQERKLDKPFPLKYSKTKPKMIWTELFVPNYEVNTIWTHMGPLYIQLVKKLDKEKAKEYIIHYTKAIEDNKNYLELFDSEGKPYNTLFYYTDEGMLWAANYLVFLL